VQGFGWVALASPLDSQSTHSGSQPKQVQPPSRGPAGEKGVRGAHAGGCAGEERSRWGEGGEARVSVL
jgi:hypothetical protein